MPSNFRFCLPGKGLRYLWTIIVIADVHWCFIQWAIILRPSPPNLTFQHWSGLTPYTSSYELAESCVFDKQSLEIRLLQPNILADLGRPYCELTATDLPSSLTRFHPFTLAYLRLSTCVGLRYGFSILFKYGFSGKLARLGSLYKYNFRSILLASDCP